MAAADLLDEFEHLDRPPPVPSAADQRSALANAALRHSSAECLAPAKQAIKKVNYSHDGMINLILTNPGISQDHLALLMGYSPSWISMIMSSDAFQARLAERTHELIDPTIKATAEDNLKGIFHRSVEILKQKLNQPAAAISDNLALKTAEMSARALGYGAREQNVQVQVNVDTHLEHLGERLTTLLAAKKKEVIDQ